MSFSLDHFSGDSRPSASSKAAGPTPLGQLLLHIGYIFDKPVVSLPGLFTLIQ